MRTIRRAVILILGMGAADSSRPVGDAPRCSYCGGVIGVYEPVIQVVGDSALTTSRAAQPNLPTSESGLVYHGVCYELSGRVRIA